MAVLQLYSDGGSRSNPGPSGLGVAGYHVSDDGSKECIFEKGVFLENCSNNLAEYMALLESLNYATSSDYQNIELYADSKLIVEQVTGNWKVKSPELKGWSETCTSRMNSMRRAGIQVKLTWIPREKNVHADSLANLAMDRRGNAEYRRDVRQQDKIRLLHEAMKEHEELVSSLVREPKRSKIQKLKASYDRIKQVWECLHL